MENIECPRRIIPLGVFPSCENIKTSVVAISSGNWKAHVMFNGVLLVEESELNEGEEVVFINNWPQEVLLHMRIVRPDGSFYDEHFYSFKSILSKKL